MSEIQQQLAVLSKLIEYAPTTVSYAWELTSVYMCYSQEDEFSTSLFRLLQLCCTYSQSISMVVLQTVRPLCVIMIGGTVMCQRERR